jgi:hypothetical protein
MRTVAICERIIHVHVSELREFPCERRIVLLLSRVEPEILEEEHITGLHCSCHGESLFARARWRKLYTAREQPLEHRDQRTLAEGRIGSILRSALVCEEDERSTVIEDVAHRRDESIDPFRIDDDPPFDGNVKPRAEKDTFSSHILNIER